MFTHTSRRNHFLARRTRNEDPTPTAIAGGVVAVALIVAFGLWVWPELHRTIRIHRM